MPPTPEQPIRILHLISTLNIGGAEQNLGHLVTGMDQTVFQNMVVSMTGSGPIGEKIAGLGIPVAMLNMKKGLPDPRGVLRLRRIIRVFQPDIIQTWMYHANLLGLLFTSARPLLWNIRCADIDISQYGHIYRWSVLAGAYSAKVPQAVIVNSVAGKDTHEQLGYRPHRWEIIPNGFDTGLYRPDPEARVGMRTELNIPPDAIVIGLIARLDPMKDHRTFFAAAHILLDAYPDVHFVLAGRGIEPANPSLQTMLGGMARHLHLLGERHDIPRILAGLDIATSSSISEGLPNTIGESMAVGLPCVATDAGDSRRLVDDTGLIVPRQQPGALAAALAQMITAGLEVRADLGEKARMRIMTSYSLTAAVEGYQTLYREIKKSYSQ